MKSWLQSDWVKVKWRRGSEVVVWMSRCWRIKWASVSDQPVLDLFQQVILSGMPEILPADKDEETKRWRSGSIWILHCNEKNRGHELVNPGHVTSKLFDLSLTFCAVYTRLWSTLLDLILHKSNKDQECGLWITVVSKEDQMKIINKTLLLKSD